MMNYESRVIKVIIVPENEPIFSELATTIEIDDEGAGEYVRVCQPTRQENGTVCFDSKEWPLVRDAIEKLLSECRGVNS